MYASRFLTALFLILAAPAIGTTAQTHLDIENWWDVYKQGVEAFKQSDDTTAISKLQRAKENHEAPLHESMDVLYANRSTLAWRVPMVHDVHGPFVPSFFLALIAAVQGRYEESTRLDREVGSVFAPGTPELVELQKTRAFVIEQRWRRLDDHDLESLAAVMAPPDNRRALIAFRRLLDEAPPLALPAGGSGSGAALQRDDNPEPDTRLGASESGRPTTLGHTKDRGAKATTLTTSHPSGLRASKNSPAQPPSNPNVPAQGWWQWALNGIGVWIIATIVAMIGGWFRKRSNIYATPPSGGLNAGRDINITVTKDRGHAGEAEFAEGVIAFDEIHCR